MKAKKKTIKQQKAEKKEQVQLDVNHIFDEAFKDVHIERHGKTIAIKDLPDCKFKEYLLATCNDTAKICVVAHMLPKVWVAYAGYPDMKEIKINIKSMTLEWSCQFIHSAEQVFMLGEVLGQAEARKLFPQYARRKYYHSDVIIIE